MSENDSRDIAHDLLNAFLALKSRLDLAITSKNIEEMKGNIERALSRIDHEVLFCKEVLGDKSADSFAIGSFLSLSSSKLAESYPNLNITISTVRDFKVVLPSASLLNSIINMLKNSYEAGAKNFLIQVNDGKIYFYDDGPGINKEALDKIRHMGTTKKEGHGIGLLSIAKFCRMNGFEMHFKNNHKGDPFEKGFCILFKVK